MTHARKTVENAAVGVAVIDNPKSFDVLSKPGVAATIWRRQLPADLHDWIDTLPVENLPNARVVVSVEALRNAVTAILESSKLPENPLSHVFADDVVFLATQFAAVMGANALCIRFDVVQDNACRKFHIDAVTARLVCTYRGQGTQYGISTDGEEPKRVFSTPTGAPILLRGTQWPSLPASGLLHRSPPIEGTGETRLVLVLDPVFEQAEASTFR